MGLIKILEALSYLEDLKGLVLSGCVQNLNDFNVTFVSHLRELFGVWSRQFESIFLFLGLRVVILDSVLFRRRIVHDERKHHQSLVTLQKFDQMR